MLTVSDFSEVTMPTCRRSAVPEQAAVFGYHRGSNPRFRTRLQKGQYLLAFSRFRVKLANE